MPAPGVALSAVLVIAVLVAVIGIFVHRRRRTRRPGAFVDIHALRQLSWSELEILVSDYFVREGFVLRAEGGKAVDFVLEKGGERQLVQCKHWRAKSVDAPEVRDLFGHMAAMKARRAYLVTIGRFTAQATAFASGKRIELIDGKALAHMIEEVQQDPSEITQSRLDAVRNAEQTQPRRVILCPRCGRPMVQRRDRTSAETPGGKSFYGCTRYPTCKGRREIA